MANMAWKLTKSNAKAVFRGALIAGLGAVLTYVWQWAQGSDFGALTPVVVAVMSCLVNVFREWSRSDR